MKRKKMSSINKSNGSEKMLPFNHPIYNVYWRGANNHWFTMRKLHIAKAELFHHYNLLPCLGQQHMYLVHGTMNRTRIRNSIVINQSRLQDIPELATFWSSLIMSLILVDSETHPNLSMHSKILAAFSAFPDL